MRPLIILLEFQAYFYFLDMSFSCIKRKVDSYLHLFLEHLKTYSSHISNQLNFRPMVRMNMMHNAIHQLSRQENYPHTFKEICFVLVFEAF